MRQPFVGVDLFEFSILILRINAEANQNKEKQKITSHYFHTHKVIVPMNNNIIAMESNKKAQNGVLDTHL
jgi:hypothetical protein